MGDAAVANAPLNPGQLRVNHVVRLVSDIGAKRGILAFTARRKAPGVGGVGKQTGTNHEVSHFERKALKSYESFFWLTSKQVLDTEQFAKRPTGARNIL